MSKKIKLKEVRVTFANTLYEAKEFEKGDGKFRYGCTFLIEPGSENDKVIRAAYAELAQEAWGKDAAKFVERFMASSRDSAYYSGDTKAYEGYEGMMALSVNRAAKDGQPLLIDRDRSPLVYTAEHAKEGMCNTNQVGQPMKGKEGKIYSGAYVNATVDLWTQKKGGQSKYEGLRAVLLGVQFNKDGDAFSGTTKATDSDFDDLGADDDGDDLS